MVDLKKKVICLSNIIRIKEKDWVLSVSRVMTKADETMYVLTPLEAKYDADSRHEYHSPIRGGIFLSQLEMEEFIKGLIDLSSDFGNG